jgi:hypothetical protein
MGADDDVMRRQTVFRADRFDSTGGTATMMAVVTTGNGGFDKLEYREVPVPRPTVGEVLLQVLAAGVNATDMNTRLGWYSSSVTAGTQSAAKAAEGEAVAKHHGGWSGPTPFPLIQGTDCCGRVAQVVGGRSRSEAVSMTSPTSSSIPIPPARRVRGEVALDVKAALLGDGRHLARLRLLQGLQDRIVRWTPSSPQPTTRSKRSHVLSCRGQGGL